MQKATARITVGLPVRTLGELRREADRDELPLTAVVRRALRRHLEAERREVQGGGRKEREVA
jgi:hypothetical protein